MLGPLTLAVPKNVHLPYLIQVSVITKIYRLLQLVIICSVLLHNCVISIHNYSPINKFDNLID